MANDNRSNDLADLSRHYDSMLWMVTSIWAIALGGLLTYCHRHFDLWFVLFGIVLTPSAMFFAYDFRKLRRRVHAKMTDDGLRELYVGCSGLRQWDAFGLAFLLLSILWTKVLVDNVGSVLWLVGVVAGAVVLFMWGDERRSGQPRRQMTESKDRVPQQAVSPHVPVPDQEGIRFPIRGAAAYCADCDKDFRNVHCSHLGRHFICPDEGNAPNEPHLARIVVDDAPARLWLRCESNLRTWTHKWSPNAVLSKLCMMLGRSEELGTGTFLLVSTVLLCVILRFWEWLGWAGYVFLLPVIWRLADIFLANISITFTSRFPANPIRSVLFCFVSYIQIALCFAIFYVALGLQYASKDATPLSSFFFSLCTITTIVGYDDITKVKPYVAQFFGVLELIFGLFFVAIIIAQVAEWARTSRPEEGNYPLDSLK